MDSQQTTRNVKLLLLGVEDPLHARIDGAVHRGLGGGPPSGQDRGREAGSLGLPGGGPRDGPGQGTDTDHRQGTRGLLSDDVHRLPSIEEDLHSEDLPLEEDHRFVQGWTEGLHVHRHEILVPLDGGKAGTGSGLPEITAPGVHLLPTTINQDFHRLVLDFKVLRSTPPSGV